MYGHWVRDMGFFEQGLTKMDPLFWETTAKLRVFSLARSLSLSLTTHLVFFGGSREMKHDSFCECFHFMYIGGWQ